MKKTQDGNQFLNKEIYWDMIYSVIDLLAETSIWVNPSHFQIKANQPVYPNIKRGRGSEKKRLLPNGIRIDDNTYANKAIKNAIDKNINFINYHVCHIWPDTTRDTRYHTRLENLVLVPKVLAGLTDYAPEISEVLKYRSYELYGWYPEEEKIPLKPKYYPLNWGKNAISKDNKKMEYLSQQHNKNFTMEDEVKLRNLIKTVGMETFLDLFKFIAKDLEVTVLELTNLFPEFSKYAATSQSTKLANAKAIFKHNWEIEALKIIADSYRVGPVVRLRAKELLAEFD